MKTNSQTKDEILNLLKEYGNLTAKDLAIYMQARGTTVDKHMKNSI